MAKTIATEKGRALFPHLTPGKPNEKFYDGKEGSKAPYEVLLCGTPESLESTIKKLQAVHQKAIDARKAEIENTKKKLKVFPFPMVETVEDKDGNPTGEVALKCKLNAEEWTDEEIQEAAKDNIKLSGWRTDQFTIYDSQGKPYQGTEEIGNGSIIKVGILPRTWTSPSLGVGITLRIGAIQIIELMSKSGVPSDAEGWGFGKEDGFTTAEESTPKTSFEKEEDTEVNFNF